MQSLHPSRRPKFTHTYKSRACALIQSFQERCQAIIGSSTYADLFQHVACYDPHRPYDNHTSLYDLAYDLLGYEYTPELACSLLTPLSDHTKAKKDHVLLMQKARRLNHRLQKASDVMQFEHEIESTWPTLPDHNTMMKCAADYHKATSITVPLRCACCSRACEKAEVKFFPLTNVTDLVEQLHIGKLHCIE